MLKIIKQLDILSGKTLEYMLQFPFTTKPFYLMDKDGHELENAENKYQLATSLLKTIFKEDLFNCDDDEKCQTIASDAIVIDFMGVMRPLTAVVLIGVNTFGELCDRFLKIIISYGTLSEEIHVVMENYRAISIKSATRNKRQKRFGKLCNVVSEDQLLPDMREFWDRMENKRSIQKMCEILH